VYVYFMTHDYMIMIRFQNYIRTGGEKTGAFKTALTKVVTLMVVNSVCAATRVTMLILKIIHNANSFETNGVSNKQLLRSTLYFLCNK
jgi:hypothetical protein